MTLRTILLLSLGAALARSDPQCVDESGAPVDWYTLYKLPREVHSTSNPLVNEGVAYAYMTSSSEQRWKLSERSIEDPESMAGRTLAPLYSGRQKDIFTLLYNDEHPDGNTSFTAGHTKGVVALGERRGFWLVHSVPKFPPAAGKYGYPRTGHMYGQTFLCINLETAANADALGVQLAFNHPYIYSAKVPESFATSYPNLAAAAAGKHVHKPPYFHVVSLKSEAATTFVSFAKDSRFNKDLYADLVAPSLRVGLLVETWPNGRGRMNSSCRRPFVVENVRELDFGMIHPDVDFTTQHDHAKWAVSTEGSRPHVCVGDINRMESQKKRAGGTVCFSDRRAWKAFGALIKDFDRC